MIYILGPKDRKQIQNLENGGYETIITTSISDCWSKGLSPFILGPIKLYNNFSAYNVENGWQYSKVYKQHIDENNNPTDEYFKWASQGWNNKRAIRYPMGKGAIPEYSYWKGLKLKYVDARKNIYLPLYAKAVFETNSYKILEEKYIKNKKLILWDFDAYDHRNYKMNYSDVLNCADKKMGHAFILAMLLEDKKLIIKTIEEKIC